MAYEYKNAVRHSGNRFDCEVNDPAFGWLLFTADPNDPDPDGQELYARILADGDYHDPPDYTAPVRPAPPSTAELLTTIAALTERIAILEAR